MAHPVRIDDNNATALTHGSHDKEIVKLLIQYNADVNAKRNDGYTALILAVKRKKEDIIEILLQNNANVNAKDEEGRTPLFLAAGTYGNHRDTVPVV